MSGQDIQSVCLIVIRILEVLGVDYEIGGAFASALHGVFRATADVDLVARLQPEHIPPFLKCLGDQFYASDEAIFKAVREKRSFNVIHLETMIKVDVFAVNDSPYDKMEFSRRMRIHFFDAAGTVVWCCSPEDIILRKLSWYVSGGHVSERQWHDVVGVLRIHSNRLDMDYLTRWGEALGVNELLKKSIDEAAGLA